MKELTKEKIVEIVSDYTGETVEAIMSPTRTANVAFSKQLAIYTMTTMLKTSLVSIGKFWGREHDFVIHNRNRIRNNVSEPDVVHALIYIQECLKGEGFDFIHPYDLLFKEYAQMKAENRRLREQSNSALKKAS